MTAIAVLKLCATTVSIGPSIPLIISTESGRLILNTVLVTGRQPHHQRWAHNLWEKHQVVGILHPSGAATASRQGSMGEKYDGIPSELIPTADRARRGGVE